MGNYTINISQPDPQNPLDPKNLSYDDPNYVIDPTFVAGTLTITPAALTITASNQNEPYGFGGTNSALGTTDFTVSSGQLFNGDAVATVTLTTNATLSSSSHFNASTWTITPSAAIFSSGSSGNYAITYATASTGLTVVPKALSITGASAGLSKVYDGTTVDPLTGTATLSGTVPGDTVNLGTASAAFANANVGTSKTVIFSYSISGADAGDYTPIQPTPTTATITPATLLVTPGTQTATYGFGGQLAGTPASLGTSDFTADVEVNNDPNDLVPMYGSDSVNVGDPVHQRHAQQFTELQCRHLGHHPERSHRHRARQLYFYPCQWHAAYQSAWL